MIGWLAQWKIWRRKRRARRDAEMHERKRVAIMRQIANRKNAKQAWRPKLGELTVETTAALKAERWL